MLFACTHVARGVLELHGNVNRAAVAYLWDHQVSLELCLQYVIPLDMLQFIIPLHNSKFPIL